MKQVAAWIISVLAAPDDGALASRTRQAIREFARDYPVPADAQATRVALA
jgi:glycine hydroxymethyltransferase